MVAVNLLHLDLDFDRGFNFETRLNLIKDVNSVKNV